MARALDNREDEDHAAEMAVQRHDALILVLVAACGDSSARDPTETSASEDSADAAGTQGSSSATSHDSGSTTDAGAGDELASSDDDDDTPVPDVGVPNGPDLTPWLADIVPPNVGVIAGTGTSSASWFGASGTAIDGPALTGCEPFRTASLTKQFTAATVMLLVDDGLLAVDDDVADWVPEVPAGFSISIAELLSHRSGLADYLGLLSPAQSQQAWDHADLVTLAAAEGQQFAPGTQFDYSNTNYIAAGLLVEAITGQPFHEVLRARILDPVGLEHTWLEGEETGATPLRGAEIWQGELYDLTDSEHASLAWTAGAIVSTARDLQRWLDALLVAEIVLSHDSLEAMLMPSAVAQYGFGLAVDDPCGAGPTIWHDGLHPNGACDFLARVPGSDAWVVVFTNTLESDASDICRTMYELGCGLVAQAPTVHGHAPECPDGGR